MYREKKKPVQILKDQVTQWTLSWKYFDSVCNVYKFDSDIWIPQNSSGSSTWEIFSGLCSECRCDVIAVTHEAIILYDLYNTKTNPFL